MCEILGSHGGEYDAECLLGCCAVYYYRNRPMFQTCLALPSSGR
jgi:hypothetical protein